MYKAALYIHINILTLTYIFEFFKKLFSFSIYKLIFLEYLYYHKLPPICQGLSVKSAIFEKFEDRFIQNDFLIKSKIVYKMFMSHKLWLIKTIKIIVRNKVNWAFFIEIFTKIYLIIINIIKIYFITIIYIKIFFKTITFNFSFRVSIASS